MKTKLIIVLGVVSFLTNCITGCAGHNKGEASQAALTANDALNKSKDLSQSIQDKAVWLQSH